MAAYSLTFPEMKNDVFLMCIDEYMPGSKPIYFMQQNSIRLPEIREYVKKYSYVEICHDPDLAARVTLMPIKRFKLDVALMCSHIMFLPEAMGIRVVFLPDNDFKIHQPLTAANIDRLELEGVIDRLEFVGDVITHTRMRLDGNAPLLGWVGAPWTLLCYMIEGGTSKDFPKARKFFYTQYEKAIQLLDILTNLVAEFCIMQGRAGIQAIQILDLCCGCLNGQNYVDLCIPRLKLIRRKVRMTLAGGDFKIDCPMGIFAKGGFYCTNDLVKAGYEFVAIDWKTEPSYVSSRLIEVLPRTVCLVGNFDPSGLVANEDKMKELVHKMIKKFRLNRTVISFGTEVFPDCPLDVIQMWIDLVKANTDSTTSIITRSSSSLRSSRRSSDADPYFYEKLAVIREQRWERRKSE